MATVILEKDEIYKAASNGTILGAIGSETVKVLDDTVLVKTDANVERVELGHASSDYTFKAISTGIEVMYKGAAVADLQSGQKLAFTDGSAAISSTFDVTTASAVFTLGGKIVTAAGGALALALNSAAGEASTIVSAPLSTYSVTAAAASVNEGAAAIFNVVTTNVATNTLLSFAVTGTGITAADITGGALTGTTTVGADGKATITIPLAADQTTEGPETLIVYLVGKPAFAFTTVNDTSLTTAGPTVVAVSAANTTPYDASSGAVKFVVSAGDYAYKIAGFSAGDVLQFPSGNSASVLNSSFTDGAVDVQWAGAGQTVVIHLTGISNANDLLLNSVADFNAVFGAGTII